MEINKEKYVMKDKGNGKTGAWTKDKTSQLIELYKSNECLWNFWHKSYKNKEKRARAVQEICSIMKITKFEFGKKIHNLRNQFNSEMKKLKQRIEESGGNVAEKNTSLHCKWGHFESLLFLKNIIEPRPGSNGAAMAKRKRFYSHDEDNVSIKANIDAEDNTSSVCLYNIDTDSEDGNLMRAATATDQDQDHDQDDNAMDNNHTSKQSEECEVDSLKFSPKSAITSNYTLTKTVNTNCTKTPDVISSPSIYNIQSNTRCSSTLLQPILSQSARVVTTKRSMRDEDQWDAFGDLVAAELRNLNSDISRKNLKRKIMRAILDVGEEDDKYV